MRTAKRRSTALIVSRPSGRQLTDAVRLERGQLVWTLMDSGPDGYEATARTNCAWNVRGVVTQRSDGHGECYEVEIRVGYTKHSRAWYEPCELAYWNKAQWIFVAVVAGTELPMELPEHGVFAKRTEVCVHCGRNRNSEAHVDAALLTGHGHRFESAKAAPRTAWDRLGEDF